MIAVAALWIGSITLAIGRSLPGMRLSSASIAIDIRTWPHARAGLAKLLGGDRDPADAARLGAFYQVLLAGLAAVNLAEPDGTPTPADLLAAMRVITP